MKKIHKKILSFFVIFFVILSLPTTIDAVTYEYTNDYTIDSYDINVVVNENNTFDITETITAYFKVSKHGLYRKIPLTNTIKRLDGTTSKNKAHITNVNVNNKYESSKSNGYYKIKIGSANETVIGKQQYVISYNYNIGKDPIDNCDELYLNLIGPEWDAKISNVTFTITMPKEFDASKLGFSAGRVGSTNSNNVIYNVSGNTITGRYIGTLTAGDALTVRLELEEGYFVGAGIPIASEIYLLFLIPLICLIVSVFLWYKYGKDDAVIETVEFYPPKEFNSLEVGFLYKGEADNKDVVSLLIYLANKGYIKITETQRKGFKLIKLKEYDGKDTNEKLFMERLFARADKDNSVTRSDLYNYFYKTMEKILSNVNSKDNKGKIFESVASFKYFMVIMMIIITILTIIIIPTLDYAGVGEVAITLYITLFYIPFYAVGLLKSMPMLFRIFWLGFTMFHSFIFFSTMPIADALMNDITYLIGFIIGIICVIGMIICFKALPKRTPYGNEILGKLKGFKTFLETAEKEQLESMVSKNPTYFYDILPYTYVLGVSDKWINNFEAIALQAPDWYDSTSDFSTASFGSFINSTMSSARSSMASSPSSSRSGGSSSGGGSSGGGSSGGGSGGGGGGSW